MLFERIKCRLCRLCTHKQLRKEYRFFLKSASYDIKRAEGAKYIRAYGVDENGEIKIELDGGVYTVCVQYNDGSCNFFTVNKEEPEAFRGSKGH